MKKLIYIIVTTLLLTFLSGHFVLYKYVNYTHKQEFRQYLRTNTKDLRIIEIYPSQLFVSSKNLTWKDHNKEVEIDGEVYDIINIKNDGIKVLLSVVIDRLEREQFEKYKEQTASIFNDQGGRKQNTITQLLSLKGIFSNNASLTLHFACSDLVFPEAKYLLSFGYASVPVPPPIV